VNGGRFQDWLSAVRPGWRAATPSSKQSLILTSLLAIMLVVWGRAMLNTRTSAEAADTDGAAKTSHSQSAADSVNNFLSPPAQTRRVIPTLAQWASTPITGPRRNLFAVPFDSYPIDPAHPPSADGEKSDSQQADQLEERRKLVQAIKQQAADLTLEGTVLGANPKAWINGVFIGVGQSVDPTGFKVVRIESRQVTIERDGVQIELSMK
jgi:hypothetical protein